MLTWMRRTFAAAFVALGAKLALEPVILHLDILQALDLFGLETTELLAPAIISDFAHANLAESVSDVLARETKTSTCRSFATISSGLYFLLSISVLLECQKTYFRSDYFSGGASGPPCNYTVQRPSGPPDGPSIEPR